MAQLMHLSEGEKIISLFLDHENVLWKREKK